MDATRLDLFETAETNRQKLEFNNGGKKEKGGGEKGKGEKRKYGTGAGCRGELKHTTCRSSRARHGGPQGTIPNRFGNNRAHQTDVAQGSSHFPRQNCVCRRAPPTISSKKNNLKI